MIEHLLFRGGIYQVRGNFHPFLVRRTVRSFLRGRRNPELSQPRKDCESLVDLTLALRALGNVPTQDIQISIWMELGSSGRDLKIRIAIQLMLREMSFTAA